MGSCLPILKYKSAYLSEAISKDDRDTKKKIKKIKKGRDPELNSVPSRPE